MGQGYSLGCKKCGYKISANLGVGFAFPRVYEAVMKEAHDGKLGKTVQSFLMEHPDGALDCDQVLLQCDECGALERGMNRQFDNLTSGFYRLSHATTHRFEVPTKVS